MVFIAVLLIVFAANSGSAQTRSEIVQPTLLVDVNNRPLPDDPNNPNVGWRKVWPSEAKTWSAVGQLIADGDPRCSATVIKAPNCPDPAKQKAQVVTNGHCTPRAKDFKMKFGVIDGIPAAKQSEIGAKAIYSTQDHYDVGILELDQNYETLEKNFGISAAEVGTALKPGEKVRNVAIPLQGIADTDRVMRINEACVPGRKVTIVDQFRYFDHQMTVENCSVVGGSSGSGLFNEAGQLTGLMNAGTLGTKPGPTKHECEMDTCVYDGQGLPKREETNFGFDIGMLHKCYRDCKLDTTLPGCPLPDKGNSLGRIITRNDNWTSDLNRKISFISPFKNYQVKICLPAGSCDCAEPSGYQLMTDAPGRADKNGDYHTSLTPAAYMPAGSKLTAKPGDPTTFQVMCIRGQKSDGSWIMPKNATAFPLYLHAAKRMAFPALK